MRTPINTIRLRHTLRCQHHHLPFSVLLAEEDDPFVSASRVLDESLCKLCGVPSRPDGNSEAARLWEQRDYLGSDSALTGESPEICWSTIQREKEPHEHDEWLSHAGMKWDEI